MNRKTVKGTLLDEQVYFSVTEVCQICGSRREWVTELVEHGVLKPIGESRRQWEFSGSNLHTALRARRLQQDLGLNLPGVALVLDLLEEVETLRTRVRMLEPE